MTTPTIKGLSFLTVTQDDTHSFLRASYGALGACVESSKTGSGGDLTVTCYRGFGYPLQEITNAFGSTIVMKTNYSFTTKALVLHPIACIISFISFLIAAFSNKFGFIFASLAAVLAFVMTIVCLVLDFIIFAGIYNITKNVKDTKAQFGIALWFVIIAAAALLLGQLFIFFQCCCGKSRREKEAIENYHRESAYGAYSKEPVQINISNGYA